MEFKENIYLALNGIKSNKMRSALTMLGLIIGISSVITIVTVGNAMAKSVSGLLNDLGANSIQINVTAKPDEDGNYPSSMAFYEEDMMTDEMIETYQEVFKDKLSNISLSNYLGEAKSTEGRNAAKGELNGINAGGQLIMGSGLNLLAGRFFNKEEVEGVKNVVVVSDSFASKLFPNEKFTDLIGREINLEFDGDIYPFSILGIYKYEVTGFAANMVGDVSTNIFIPITTSNNIGSYDQAGYFYAQIKASESVTDIESFSRLTEKFFNERYYTGSDKQITAYNMDSMIRESQSMMSAIKLAIGVIAGISLVVGGIGVMNIMTVSVTERTREIGTRKALGAKNSAIKMQFIVEAVIICLIGGFLGVIAGAIFGYLGSMLLGERSLPDLVTVAVSLLFSMAIGVFFGYYPAKKAAMLEPIEALRYE